jgi:hypothetical protein
MAGRGPGDDLRVRRGPLRGGRGRRPAPQEAAPPGRATPGVHSAAGPGEGRQRPRSARIGGPGRPRTAAPDPERLPPHVGRFWGAFLNTRWPERTSSPNLSICMTPADTASCISRTMFSMSSVAPAVWSASRRASRATTRGPRPCSPAFSASLAASVDSRLVWPATRVVVTTWVMLSAFSRIVASSEEIEPADSTSCRMVRSMPPAARGRRRPGRVGGVAVGQRAGGAVVGAVEGGEAVAALPLRLGDVVGPGHHGAGAVEGGVGQRPGREQVGGRHGQERGAGPVAADAGQVDGEVVGPQPETGPRGQAC